MALKTRKWDVAEYLDSPGEIAGYLEAVMEIGDPAAHRGGDRRCCPRARHDADREGHRLGARSALPRTKRGWAARVRNGAESPQGSWIAAVGNSVERGLDTAATLESRMSFNDFREERFRVLDGLGTGGRWSQARATRSSRTERSLETSRRGRAATLPFRPPFRCAYAAFLRGQRAGSRSVSGKVGTKLSTNATSSATALSQRARHWLRLAPPSRRPPRCRARKAARAHRQSRDRRRRAGRKPRPELIARARGAERRGRESGARGPRCAP